MRPGDAKKKANEIEATRTVFAKVLHESTGLEFIARDPPDVHVDGSAHGPIAVEVVEPANQGLAAGMAALAKFRTALQSGLGTLNLKVHVRTRDGFIPDLADRRRAARNLEGLIALARKHDADGTGRAQYGYGDLVERGIERLLEVHIEPAARPLVFTGAQVGHAGGWMRQHVQDAIKKKSERIEHYRRHCQGRSIWLIVLAGLRFASGTQSQLVRSGKYASSFARTFYVDAADGAVFELATTRPDPD